MKRLKTFVDAKMANDTYLLIDNKQAVIIDPSFSVNKLMTYIKEEKLKVLAVLLTHGHYDHYAGLKDLGKFIDCPYYISEEDAGYLYDKRMSFGFWTVDKEPEIYTKDDLVLGDFRFSLLKVPGHTPGGVVIIWDNKMFTGDFIFHGDIGRTDLPGSSPKQMEESLKRFAEVQGDYIIYPGHEESTTLAEEKKNNPYLRRYIEN